MPEGPSIIIAKEELDQFTRKKIFDASGSAGFDMDRLTGKKITRITTWGKHLLFCFDGFYLRIHFLMFGKYFIDGHKALKPRLALKFAGKRELNFYTSAIKLHEGDPDDDYDWSADIMNKKWSMAGAKKKLKAIPNTFIADALMDQEIFSGVGNIIKNEILYRVKIHPGSLTGGIPARKITALCKAARDYAFEFLEQRKAGTLSKNWQVYTR
ncbi:MAG: DNA-formamidopyrimidine glycosylase family protein, partial [Flavitalea sp.]